MSEAFGLTDVIGNLRKEIAAAAVAGQGHDLQFDLGAVEVELNVVVTKSGKAGGTLEFKVLGLGASASTEGMLTAARTQRIKLSLTPKGRDGGIITVSSRAVDGD